MMTAETPRRREHAARNAIITLYVLAIIAGFINWRVQGPDTSELDLLIFPVYMAIALALAAIVLGYFLSVLIAAALLRTSLSVWLIVPIASVSGLAVSVLALAGVPIIFG
jgi:hypothetical protein